MKFFKFVINALIANRQQQADSYRRGYRYYY
jgi:hypothetical protein